MQGASTVSPRGGASGWPQSTDASQTTAFGNTGLGGGKLQEIENAPALVANYPKGSYAGAHGNIGGFIFDAHGPSDVKLDNATKASFSYEVKFPSGFEFALGGKLPGLFGGTSYAACEKAAGGNHVQGCWSARLMFRTNGAGELYAYLPSGNKVTCSGPCDAKYGDSIDRGAWTFNTGEWTSLEEIVTLNTLGKSDGEIEVLVGGASKIKEGGLNLRSTAEQKIQGIMIHTFFGGSSMPAYASPKTQEAYFRNFVVKVLE